MDMQRGGHMVLLFPHTWKVTFLSTKSCFMSHCLLFFSLCSEFFFSFRILTSTFMSYTDRKRNKQRDSDKNREKERDVYKFNISFYITKNIIICKVCLISLTKIISNSFHFPANALSLFFSKVKD